MLEWHIKKVLEQSDYRSYQAFVFVYDVTNHTTFNNVNSWMQEIDLYAAREDMIKVLVGNKCDLEDKKCVNFQTAKVLFILLVRCTIYIYILTYC